MTTLGSISTTAMADAALADAQNATRIYNAFFGKLPYTRLAMTQQPAAGFGQAWPTLVYMPYLAYIDTTQRAQLLGTRGGTDTFWRYVGPHEVAHQWWGHVIGWDSYRDQWMSEGFAEFSASLYVQIIRGHDKFIDFWEDLRRADNPGVAGNEGSQAVHGWTSHAGLSTQQWQDRCGRSETDLSEGRIHSPHAENDDV